SRFLHVVLGLTTFLAGRNLRITKYIGSASSTGTGPHLRAKGALPTKATTLIASGAPTTEKRPARLHGMRNGRGISRFVLRKRPDESTVRIVTPMRSQTYTVNSCTIVFCASKT